MMRKYKLIKEYPGSPELGQIASPYRGSENSIVHYVVEHKKKDCDYLAIRQKYIENNPEYWEEVKDIYYMVSLKDMLFRNAWEVIEVGSIHYKNTDSKRFFKTKEEAESFILYNKPCLSYNDIRYILDEFQSESIIDDIKSKL